jgi:hypothetical protein
MPTATRPTALLRSPRFLDHNTGDHVENANRLPAIDGFEVEANRSVESRGAELFTVADLRIRQVGVPQIRLLEFRVCQVCLAQSHPSGIGLGHIRSREVGAGQVSVRGGGTGEIGAFQVGSGQVTPERLVNDRSLSARFFGWVIASAPWWGRDAMAKAESGSVSGRVAWYSS